MKNALNYDCCKSAINSDETVKNDVLYLKKFLTCATIKVAVYSLSYEIYGGKTMQTGKITALYTDSPMTTESTQKAEVSNIRKRY